MGLTNHVNTTWTNGIERTLDLYRGLHVWEYWGVNSILLEVSIRWEAEIATKPGILSPCATY
jgi:hypothetical protein